MRSIGIKALKNRLSEYVRLAAGGETVLVTDRDQVVAELTAPSPGRAGSVDDAALADAIRRGLLSPPHRTAGPLQPRIPVAPLSRLLRELARDRDDR